MNKPKMPSRDRPQAARTVANIKKDPASGSVVTQATALFPHKYIKRMGSERHDGDRPAAIHGWAAAISWLFRPFLIAAIATIQSFLSVSAAGRFARASLGRSRRTSAPVRSR